MLFKLRARFVLIDIRQGAASLSALIGHRVLVLHYWRFGLTLLLLLILGILILLVLRWRNDIVLTARSKNIVTHIIEKV